MPNTDKLCTLRGWVYSKYSSAASFADATGMQRQRMHKIMNGAQKPDVDDVNKMATALDKSVADVLDIFLTK